MPEDGNDIDILIELNTGIDKHLNIWLPIYIKGCHIKNGKVILTQKLRLKSYLQITYIHLL